MANEPSLVDENSDGQRLDRWLQQKFPYVAYPFIQKSLRTGDIRINGKKVDGKARLAGGDLVRLPPLFYHTDKPDMHRPLSEAELKQAKWMKLSEDDYILAINKPHGLATQGGTKTFQHVDRLLGAYIDPFGDKPKLVHRLDKETSGIMIAAKNRNVAARLGHAFKHRDIEKTYLAITVGVPRSHEDVINRPLAKKPTPEGDRVMVDKEIGKEAVTLYKVLSFSGVDMALVALRPKTGRMHQLRAHLQHIHTPILGDAKYGGVLHGGPLEKASKERLWLHALYLHFPHPATGETVDLSAPVPKPMRDWLDEWHMSVPDVTDTQTPIDPLDGFNP